LFVGEGEGGKKKTKGMRVGEREGRKRMAINEGKGNKGRRVGVGDKRKYRGGGKKIKEEMILCIKLIHKVILRFSLPLILHVPPILRFFSYSESV
jgi:hypothetical protein